MIDVESVTFTYPDSTRPALDRVDVHVPAGELCLVVGPTGSGKSTLLRTLNGMVPRFSGGTLSGRVTVAGRDTRHHDLRSMSEVVGLVPQDPATGFVTETVEEELAFTMEQLGVDPLAMRKRVEETLDLLGLAHLRARPLRTLSGGEAQRVAIGSALTAHPDVLVLDEPTSSLDPTAAEEVLSALLRLVHDLGTTVVVAEHRLERVVQYADRVVHIDPDGRATSGEPAPMMGASSVAPPVVELAKAAGWSPPPLSIRDARRRAPELIGRLGTPPLPASLPPAPPLVSIEDLVVVHGDVVAVRAVDLDLSPRSITAVMGRNGAGKSSLLWAIEGTGPRHRGSIRVRAGTAGDADRRRVGLVPQSPTDLLYLETVADECAQADRESGAEPGTCGRLARRIVGDLHPDGHPADLSEGQRLGLVLAIQLASHPDVVLLDEPTRGLDYHAKERLGEVLSELAAAGKVVVVATHDVEFVAEVADRVVVVADGEIVADGPTAEVVAASPAVAPQVAKVLAPHPWLTVGQVAANLTGEAV